MVLIFNLGRKGGSLHYANNIIANLDVSLHRRFIVFRSSKADLKVEVTRNRAVTVPMYTNVLGFFVASLTVLPIILLSLILIRPFFRVIYFPYFHYWSVPVLAMSRLLRYNSLVTVHDGILHAGDGSFMEQTLNYLYLKFSNRVIFLTEYVREKCFAKMPGSSKKGSVIIPHGIIPIQGLTPARRTLAINRPLRILFFGRVIKYKGVELLPKISAELSAMGVEHRFKVVGKWNYIRPNSILQSETIDVVDQYVSEEAIADYFNQADVLIMPYLEATQSGVASLAIYSGIPIVATDVGGLPEQIGDAGLIVRSDAWGLAQAIKKLYCQPDIYTGLSDNATKIRKSLSWEGIAGRVGDFIRKS